MEFKSISQLKSLLDENKISVKEIAQTYIKKINEKKDLNIFIYFNEDKIHDQVKEIENLCQHQVITLLFLKKFHFILINLT